MKLLRKKTLSMGAIVGIALLPLVAYIITDHVDSIAFEAEKQIATIVAQQPEERVQATPEPEPFFQEKTFGTSVTGRPITGYVIGTGNDVVLLFGSIHGNEMGTTDLLNQFVREVKDKPHLVAPTKRLVVIPMANPDGYYDRIDKLNANEVNLNLNFDTTDWKQYGENGTFAGDRPFTEPESRVLAEVVETYKPNLMLAYHARGALVSPEGSDESRGWGRWYARKTGYQYFVEWDYSGTATRWFTEKYGRPAITIELTQYLRSDWSINKRALLELAALDKVPF